MIIVRIQGGLGNQLFEYAAARCLAEKWQVECKIDTSSLHAHQLRQLDLEHFELTVHKASLKEIKQFSLFPQLYRHAPAFFSKLGRNIYREPHFHFDPRFFTLTDPVYLDGYFQSEKYFKPIENLLRRELTVKENLIKHLATYKEKLQQQESVAVHIRRGDYAQKKMLEIHGLQPPAYYNEAIKKMAQKLNRPFFYFFSDDIEWVKANITLDHPHEFITGFTQTAIEDFYLMTQCKHTIIANSSFSWWAAWLNNNTNKIVIAPAKWFNKAPHNTQDLLSANWLVI
jgi:hypothetical protein